MCARLRIERFLLQRVQLEMKARRIFWPIPFLVAGLIGWNSIPPRPPTGVPPPLLLSLNGVWGKRYVNGPGVKARIEVQKKQTLTANFGGAQRGSDSRYEPNFMRANDFRQILIPATPSKPAQQAVNLPL